MILEFKDKYSNLKSIEVDEFWFDAEHLILVCENENSLKVCFETLLEAHFPSELLIKIIERNKNVKKQILEDSNTFKWAVGYGEEKIISYLRNSGCQIDIGGAIFAGINQYRVDNLILLDSWGYGKELFAENNFLHAVSRSSMVGCGLMIVDYFFTNKNRYDFIKECEYTNKRLLEKDFFNQSIFTENFKDIAYEPINTFKFFLSWQSEENQKKIDLELPKIIKSLVGWQKIDYIKLLLSGERHEFTVNFFKRNTKSIIRSCVDNFDEKQTEKFFLNELIGLDLIKKNDIKLWLMNSDSVSLYEYIKSFRTVPESEVKKSLVELSSCAVCFPYVVDKFQEFNYDTLEITRIVELLNNHYLSEDNMSLDDISQDSINMKLYRKILSNHRDFLRCEKEVMEQVHFKSLVSLLYREILENKLLIDLENKPLSKLKKI